MKYNEWLLQIAALLDTNPIKIESISNIQSLYNKTITAKDAACIIIAQRNNNVEKLRKLLKKIGFICTTIDLNKTTDLILMKKKLNQDSILMDLKTNDDVPKIFNLIEELIYN